MKRFNSLDMLMTAAAVTAAVIVCFFLIRTNFFDTRNMQITLIITEDIDDSAKHLKSGDTVWIADSDNALGTIASLKSTDGGLAVTVDAAVTEKGGVKYAGGTVMKLGKSYTFRTKRVVGDAVCEAIDGGSK